MTHIIRDPIHSTWADDDLQRLIIDDTHDPVNLFQCVNVCLRSIFQRQSNTCHTMRELTDVLFPPDMCEDIPC